MAVLDVRKMYAKYEGVLLRFYLERDYAQNYAFEGTYPVKKYQEFHRFYTLIDVLTPHEARESMAAKKKTEFTPIEFVNIDWEDRHEAEFEDWVITHKEDWHNHVASMCADLYKFGLAWDDDNATYIVSVTCKDDRGINANKCFTARSDDWVEALQIAVFKHEVITKEDWGKARKKGIRG